MKKSAFWVLALFVAFAAVSVPASAECDGKGGKQCSMNKECKHGKDCKDCDGDYQCPITGKIMKKAKFFLKNDKEIGLSDEQVAQIKAIKEDAKKNYIRVEADMKIAMMDLESKLSEPKVDVEGLNGMVDKMSAGFAANSKESIAAYAKLKGILSEEQMAKAKEIWTKSDKTDK